MMRRCVLLVGLCSAVLFANRLHAGPDESDPKKVVSKKKLAAFKPIAFDGELTANDDKDAKLNNPAKTYQIKLKKDQSYIIDLVSKDFDTYLRVLDKNGTELAEDDDGGGDLNSRLIFSPKEDGEFKIVAASFDGEVGKFNLKVREFKITAEAKTRDVGKDGLAINASIGANDMSDLGKLGKTYSIQMKAGQTYTIDLESADLDSFLYLFDSKGKKLAEDDDSGGDLNSRVVFRAPADGVYHIIATSLGGDETGDIALKVRKE